MHKMCQIPHPPPLSYEPPARSGYFNYTAPLYGPCGSGRTLALALSLLPMTTESVGVSKVFGSVCLSVCPHHNSKKRIIPPKCSTMVYHRNDCAFGIERSKVKVTESIIAFFTLIICLCKSQCIFDTDNSNTPWVRTL